MDSVGTRRWNHGVSEAGRRETGPLQGVPKVARVDNWMTYQRTLRTTGAGW